MTTPAAKDAPKPSRLLRRFFEGKRVLLTGASSGIGERLAIDLASHGARLVLVARRASVLEDLARRLDPSRKRVLSLPADLSKELPEKIVAKAVNALGGLDVLVNCAGIMAFESIVNLSPEAIDELLRVNLQVPIRLVRAALPELSKNRGAICHVASLSGVVSLPYYQIYTASKHGLVGFTRSVAYELERHGVSQTTILPGAVATPMVSDLVEIAKKNGMGFAKAEDVARASLVATARRKREVQLGLANRLGVLLGKTFPWLERIVLRRTERVMLRELVRLRDEKKTAS